MKVKKLKKRQNIQKPMTICIAAICEIENDPKIVFAADRLISAGIQFEHGVPKITPLTDYCFVMVSSTDSLKSDMLISNVKNKVKGQNFKIKEIIEIFSKECKLLINSEREEQVLSKFGLTYDSFLKKSKELSQDLIRLIGLELENFESSFKTEFIILGLEPQAELYVINQNGEYKPYGMLGFACIGSGSDLAFPEMTKYAYTPILSLPEALVRVYQAKKVSERVSGVGKYTDLFVLHIPEEFKKNSKEKWIPSPWLVNQKIIKILEEGLDKIQSDEVTHYKEMFEGIIKEIGTVKKHEEIAKPIKDKMKKNEISTKL